MGGRAESVAWRHEAGCVQDNQPSLLWSHRYFSIGVATDRQRGPYPPEGESGAHNGWEPETPAGSVRGRTRGGDPSESRTERAKKITEGGDPVMARDSPFASRRNVRRKVWFGGPGRHPANDAGGGRSRRWASFPNERFQSREVPNSVL